MILTCTGSGFRRIQSGDSVAIMNNGTNLRLTVTKKGDEFDYRTNFVYEIDQPEIFFHQEDEATEITIAGFIEVDGNEDLYERFDIHLK